MRRAMPATHATLISAPAALFAITATMVATTSQVMTITATTTAMSATSLVTPATMRAITGNCHKYSDARYNEGCDNDVYFYYNDGSPNGNASNNCDTSITSHTDGHTRRKSSNDGYRVGYPSYADRHPSINYRATTVTAVTPATIPVITATLMATPATIPAITAPPTSFGYSCRNASI